jgi:hypothetical protein
MIFTEPKLVSTYLLPKIRELLSVTVNYQLMRITIVAFPSFQRQK